MSASLREHADFLSDYLFKSMLSVFLFRCIFRHARFLYMLLEDSRTPPLQSYSYVGTYAGMRSFIYILLEDSSTPPLQSYSYVVHVQACALLIHAAGRQ